MNLGYSCLRQSRVFINLVDDHIQKIGQKLRHVDLDKGQLLFAASQPLKDLYIIRNGHIKIYSIQDGKESIIEILSAGDTFGSFGDVTTRKGLFAEAIDSAGVCKLEHSQFRELISTYPEIAMSILEELTSRLDQAHQKIANITLGDAQEKVLSGLQRLSKRLGTQAGEGYYQLNQKFSHQQIADMVGLSRESVSHAFTKLKKSEDLKLNGSTLLVRSSSLLKTP